MRFRDKQAVKRSIRHAARQTGVSYAESRQQMAEAIDAAWATTDPEAKAYQDRMFPGGKPTLEQFIVTLGRRIREQQ